MSAIRSNLRLIIKSQNVDETIVTISNSPEVIRDIEYGIEDFMIRRNDLKIEKTGEDVFKLSSKAYIAIQNIIYQIIR